MKKATGPIVNQPRTPRSNSLRLGVIASKMEDEMGVIDPSSPSTWERPDVIDADKVMTKAPGSRMSSVQHSRPAPFRIK